MLGPALVTAYSQDAASASTSPGLLIMKSAVPLLDQPVPPDTLYLTGPSTHLAWEPGTIRVFTDVNKLKYRLENGWRGTALLDIERWSHTPTYQWEHPIYTFRRAWKIARAYGIRLIDSPAPDLWGWRHMDLYEAAIPQIHASRLAVQGQVWQIGPYWPAPATDSKFLSFMRYATTHANEPVWGGLSTCAMGIPRTITEMVKSFTDAVSTGVPRIWLNIPESGPSKSGPGCPDGNPQPADAIIGSFS